MKGQVRVVQVKAHRHLLASIVNTTWSAITEAPNTSIVILPLFPPSSRLPRASRPSRRPPWSSSRHTHVLDSKFIKFFPNKLQSEGGREVSPAHWQQAWRREAGCVEPPDWLPLMTSQARSFPGRWLVPSLVSQEARFPPLWLLYALAFFWVPFDLHLFSFMHLLASLSAFH